MDPLYTGQNEHLNNNLERFIISTKFLVLSNEYDEERRKTVLPRNIRFSIKYG